MGSKAAMKTMKEADVILAIGTRLSVFGILASYDIEYKPKNADIIQIDINPRNITHTHPVEVGLIADEKTASAEIYNQLKGTEKAVDNARMEKISTLKADWEKELVDLAMVEGDPINPRRALLELRKAFPDKDRKSVV